tara:strand:- start:25547 stop:26026 length:480 start_codon:yes stop_codon:yes gene_type:complete
MSEGPLTNQNQTESLSSKFLQYVVTEVIGNKEAAKHWNVPVKTIQEWVKAGMPISGPNNRRTFNIAECESWLQGRIADPDPQQPEPGKMAFDPDDRETMSESVKENEIHSGDPCGNPKGCPGNYRVLSCVRTDTRRIRHLACSICNYKPKNNKEVIRIR